MSVKKNIKRVGILMLWLAFVTGSMVLLVAAIKKKDTTTCKAVEVDIKGVGVYYFLNKKEILSIAQGGSSKKMVGREVASFDLRKMESRLEQNIWVRDAELFFDNNYVLHVNVNEREPIARLFTAMGSSFYIDSSGKKLPLSNHMNVVLPVFTNYPAEVTTGLNKNGKKLVTDIKKISTFILKDPFWMAQIAQVDIVGGQNFELVPTVGKHVIEFGSGDDYANKFKKLFVFYKDVVSKVGFDKYSRIDVRYDKQVVGTKRGSVTKVDSVQAMKNIEKMIAAALKPIEDTIKK